MVPARVAARRQARSAPTLIPGIGRGGSDGGTVNPRTAAAIG